MHPQKNTNEKEAVLSYINESGGVHLHFKINKKAIVDKLSLNRMQVNEMIKRFKDAKRIQKDRDRYK